MKIGSLVVSGYSYSKKSFALTQDVFEGMKATTLLSKNRHSNQKKMLKQ